MKHMKKYSKELKEVFSYLKEDKLILLSSLFISFVSVTSLILCSFFVGSTLNLLTEDINKETLLKITYSTLIILILYLIYWITSSRILIWMVKLSHRTGSKIRKSVFVKLLNVPISYLDKNKVGELLTRATNDIDIMIANMVQIIALGFISPTMIIATIIILFVMSPLLALISISIMVLIFLILFWIAKKSSPDFANMQDKISKMNGLNKEYITNKVAIYMFRRQQTINTKYLVVNNSHKQSSYKAELKIGLVYPVLDILENIFYGIIYIIGFVFIIKEVPAGGVAELGIGTLTSFVMIVRNTNGEVGNIARFASMYEKLYACIQRIFEILSIDDDVDKGMLEEKNLIGNIEFKNVNFAYNKNYPVIKNFNLTIKQGQTVAIVGPTGSGKTTLINLLMRFYEIDSGSITIAGTDITKLKKENLRQFISIVLQDPHLFSESIYTNIAYGNHAQKINKTKIQQAAKEIGSLHFINLLPQGFDTIIDNVDDISNGESQLLTLTRAYYSPSNIVILDEATSSIDSKTEHDVQEGLKKILESKTTIIIAHRLSTIINSDLIVVMKAGEIIEQGTHQELIANKNFYYQLYNSNSLETDDI